MHFFENVTKSKIDCFALYWFFNGDFNARQKKTVEIGDFNAHDL